LRHRLLASEIVRAKERLHPAGPIDALNHSPRRFAALRFSSSVGPRSVRRHIEARRSRGANGLKDPLCGFGSVENQKKYGAAHLQLN
jgi:hypothetical protein